MRNRRLLLVFLLPLGLLSLGLGACGDTGLGTGSKPGTPFACESIVDEPSCRARADCETVGCPLCGQKFSFSGCYTQGKGPLINCPAVACSAACGAHPDEASCDSDSSCHAVFRDSDTCDCTAPGCCMQFSTCAEGPALCGPTTGTTETCATVVCGPGYTPGYTSGEGCADGCIRQIDCLQTDE
jgi:hypothetical protein